MSVKVSLNLTSLLLSVAVILLVVQNEQQRQDITDLKNQTVKLEQDVKEIDQKLKSISERGMLDGVKESVNEWGGEIKENAIKTLESIVKDLKKDKED